MTNAPHVQAAAKYARDVASGKVSACKFVRQACARQLDDLERYAEHKAIVWSDQHAEHICNFVEKLPHVKGPKARGDGEEIHLEPWQCFILTTVFGWRRKDTGGRRFRRAYIEVPRGNAKSTLSSAVGLYCLALDGEAGADIYCAATTRDQARIVYGDAFSMLKKRPDLAEQLGIESPKNATTAAHITHPKSRSKFLPLSRESTNMDGLNVHLGIIDELHAHQTREIYDVIETGTTKRTSSLLWVITTAGSDTAGICYEIRGYALKVLDGQEDDAQFGIVYTLDETDDWQQEESWKKANPNWGVSVMPDATAQLARKAMTQISAQNNFKRKILDIWDNAAVQWMDMRAWDRMAIPDLEPEKFKRDPLYIGLDLATKVDIAAKARIFVRRHPAWVAGCPEHDKPGRVDCHDCYDPNGKGVEPHERNLLFS